MELLISIAGAIIPSVLILRYFLKKDLHPEPAGIIAGTFFLGVVTVLPVLLIGVPLMYLNPFKGSAFCSALYTAFLVAAKPEEYFKFRVLSRFSARNRAFDEPMDGIVYGVTASLGFATLENVLYVLQGGLSTALIRAFTAVPAHASWGAVMGYYFGCARFDRKGRKSLYFGLFAAVILHGLYDVTLMYLSNSYEISGPHDITESEMKAILVFLAVFIISIVWAVSSAKSLRKLQDENRTL